MEKIFHKRIEEVRTIGLEQLSGNDESLSYRDADMVIYTDIRELTQIYRIEEPGGVFKTAMTVIIYCTTGRLQMEVNGEVRTLEAGQVAVVVPQTLVKNYMLSPDFQCMIMCVSTHILQASLQSDINLWNDSLYVRRNDTFTVSSESLELLLLYQQLFSYKRQHPQTQFYKRTMQSLVQAILYEICGHLCQPLAQQQEIPTPTANQGRNLFYNFLELLKRTEQKRQTVEHYATILCVTPKYLSFVCKRETGRTALEWIQDYLLEDIRFHLNNPRLTIKEVAARTGFTNLSFFGRYVKEHFGVAPRNYRKELQKT